MRDWVRHARVDPSASSCRTREGMSRQRGSGPRLDVEALPPDISAAIEAAIAGENIALTRLGHPIGSLEFRSNVVPGTVIESQAQHGSAASAHQGVSVVATAMRLSDAARRRLSDEFGDDYIVVDIHEAPASADVLLTHPVSPQLLGILRQQFPHAQVLVTEIEDEELGVRYAGPVSRMLDAGAAAYLPPRPIAGVAANVHAFLRQESEPTLDSGTPASKTLRAPPAREIAP